LPGIARIVGLISANAALFQPQPNQRAIHHLIIQPHLVRDLVGLDEDRLGFRDVFVSQVLEEGGEWTVVQVEVLGSVLGLNWSIGAQGYRVTQS
jgi:hypothetical protein